jgi:hypothetical protein
MLPQGAVGELDDAGHDAEPTMQGSTMQSSTMQGSTIRRDLGGLTASYGSSWYGTVF